VPDAKCLTPDASRHVPHSHVRARTLPTGTRHRLTTGRQRRATLPRQDHPRAMPIRPPADANMGIP